MTGLEGRGAAGRWREPPEACPLLSTCLCPEMPRDKLTMRWAQGETPRPHGEGEGPPKAPG